MRETTMPPFLVWTFYFIAWEFRSLVWDVSPIALTAIYTKTKSPLARNVLSRAWEVKPPALTLWEFDRFAVA